MAHLYEEVISKDPMLIVHNNKDYECDYSNVFVEDLTEKLLPFYVNTIKSI